MKRLSFFISMITLIAFMSSCQEDNLSDLDDAKSNEVAEFQEAKVESTQEVILEKPDTLMDALESRGGWVKIHEDVREMHSGHWYSAYLAKGHLDPHCKYILKVTPLHGNADAYILGKNHHGEYRHIRWSNRSHGVDETHAYYSDLHDDEYRMYFSVYARNSCKFKVEIYKVCDQQQNRTELYFKNLDASQYYHKGVDLYAKVHAYDYRGVKSVKLFVNGHFVRQEDHSPYEWGKPHSQNDHLLNNMQSGTYELKAEMRTHHGQVYVKKIRVHITGYQNDYPTINIKKIEVGGYGRGHRDLYLQVDADDKDGIEYVELYVNGHLVRRESHSPYEWGKPHSYNDHALNDLHPGTYWLTIKAKDKRGYVKIKKVQIRVH
ncbi:MAG: hypothetical protein AAGG68_01465 [Bacteroidota bacterium]